jgi:glycerophosphoryl diester phosphodiesterase
VSPSAPHDWASVHIVAITHNGGEDEFPSDTLYALQQAHDLGMQVLDVDLQESKDGQPVLTHNDTLDARTSGHGPVANLTAEQLGQLDAAYWFVPGCGNCSGKPASAYPYRGVRTGTRPLPAGAKRRADFGVPTLRQVFERFPDSVIDIELKPQSQTATTVAALIHEFHREKRTIVASFDDDQIAEFQKLAPTVATSPGQKATTAFFLGKPLPAGFKVIQIPYKYELSGQQVTVLTPAFVQRAHQEGLAVWVWDEGGTPGAALYRELVALHPDGILGAKPGDLLHVLRATGTLWNGKS